MLFKTWTFVFCLYPYFICLGFDRFCFIQIVPFKAFQLAYALYLDVVASPCYQVVVNFSFLFKLLYLTCKFWFFIDLAVLSIKSFNSVLPLSKFSYWSLPLWQWYVLIISQVWDPKVICSWIKPLHPICPCSSVFSSSSKAKHKQYTKVPKRKRNWTRNICLPNGRDTQTGPSNKRFHRSHLKKNLNFWQNLILGSTKILASHASEMKS